MLKLNVGVSKKVGRPNYGSKGASVAFELELPSESAEHASGLRQRIREMFASAAAAVDEELAGREAEAEAAAPTTCEPSGEGAASASYRRANRRATPRQVRTLETLAEHRGADLPHLATYYFRVDDVTQLTRRQASLLIRRLLAAQNSEPIASSGSG